MLTYAQRRSHDLAHYARPQKLVGGQVRPPSVTILNPKIVRRHMASVLLAAFLRWCVDERGRFAERRMAGARREDDPQDDRRATLSTGPLVHGALRAVRLALPARARAQAMPRVEIVDLRSVGAGPTGDKRLSITLHRALEETARELVGQLELDLAGRLGERAEPPFAVQVAERAVDQRDDDRFAGHVRVGRREVRADAVVVDVHPRDPSGLATVEHLRSNAAALAPMNPP